MHPNDTADRTPGPWSLKRATEPVDGEYDFAIAATIDGAPYCIAETFGRVAQSIRPNAEANARFIVQACNAHDDLVKALGEVRDRLEVYVNAINADLSHNLGWPDTGGRTMHRRGLEGLEIARAVLALATTPTQEP